MNSIVNYFKKNNLAANVILTVLSTFITELLVSFLENIISPVFDVNKDGIPDNKNLMNLTIKTKNSNIYIGKFLLTFIKFLVVLLMIVLFIYLTK